MPLTARASIDARMNPSTASKAVFCERNLRSPHRTIASAARKTMMPRRLIWVKVSSVASRPRPRALAKIKGESRHAHPHVSRSLQVETNRMPGYSRTKRGCIVLVMAITPRRAPAALIMLLSLAVTGVVAQTAVKLAKNKYTPQQDVELGREAAAEVRTAVSRHRRISGSPAISAS